jgi:cysteine-rich repeat protein
VSASLRYAAVMRGRMFEISVLAAAMLGGCVDSAVEVCDDGTLCPAGFSCQGALGCVSDLEGCLADGAPVVDGTACQLLGNDGLCQGGRCVVPQCGNGVVEAPEVCDDGNREAGDGCDVNCASDETCGNGYRDAGEACDDGNTVDGDTCQADCELPTCGDGVIDAARGEVCDDDNTSSGDGCSADCTSNETCGNTVTDALAGEACDDGGQRNRDGCSSTCEVEALTWTELGVAPTVPKRATAYDPTRQRLVSFGGCCGIAGAADDATWEWDGASWQRVVTANAPTPRVDTALAFDPRAQRILLFGGDAGGPRADMWHYDGVDWTIVPLVGERPPARFAHALATDGARGNIMLVGGANAGGKLADVWSWDGDAWTDVTPVGWPGRSGHALAFDARRAVTVLYGGAPSDGGARDTLEFDGATWTTFPDTGPSQLLGLVLAYDPVRQATVMASGDATPAKTNATWEWDGAAWTEHEGIPTSPRYVATGGYDVAHAQLVVSGGISTDGGEFTDTFVRDVDGAWRPVRDAVPGGRQHAAIASDRTRGEAVLFGGFDDQLFGPRGDTWRYAGGSWTELSPPTSPAPRTDAAMAFDEAAGEAYLLFGSADGETALDEMWAWDGVTWRELALPAVGARHPAPRRWHTLAWDGAAQRLVLFGGLGDDSLAGRDDTWIWQAGQWTQLTPALRPPGRMQHQMAFDPVRGGVVIMGGVAVADGADVVDDAWLLVGDTWTQLEVEGAAPAGRVAGSLAYDAEGGELVLSMGAERRNGALVVTDSTWALGAPDPVDGATRWRELTPPLATPQPRWRHVGFYDAALRQHVIAGGAGFNQLDDAWALGYAAVIAPQACAGATDTDGDELVGCDDDDCRSWCQPWCSPAEELAGLCAVDAPTCGDLACDPLEDCRACAVDCGVCAGPCGDLACDDGEDVACPGDCAP